jgi:RsiW-degrading membrane proteinase PrsW (M82 family)
MAEELTCCICGDRVAPPYRIVGQRVYCERHYATVNKPNPGFWRAGIIQIIGVGVVSAIVAFLASLLGPLDQAMLILVGVILAIVPSAVWLYFFYRQDRLEPEPKTRIAAVFLLAMLLTDALGLRIIDNWFQIRAWAWADSSTSLLASILIIGFTRQAIAYASVRLVVYDTPEFDERMDGIVYGTVAGLGVATLLNLNYVIANGGVALGPGVIQVVTTALAQASFSGLLGYFMAGAKFEHKPIWWVPLGLCIAAVLNGLFSWLLSEVSADGLAVSPWRSLVLGIAVALAVFALLLALMRRATQETLSQAAAGSE